MRHHVADAGSGNAWYPAALSVLRGYIRRRELIIVLTFSDN